MSSDTHVRARTALQGRMQRVRTCTDRSRVRAACCPGAKTMAPMQRAQGRPVTAQYAAQVREAPTAVAARWEHPHRASWQRNGADARSESTRDGVRLRVSQGGARHWSRWCTGVMPPSSPEPPRPGIAAFPPVAYMPARLRVFRGLLRADGPTRVCLLLRLPCEEVRMPARLRGRRGVPRPPFARRVVCSLTRVNRT
jgi:hypothetical protein